MEGRRCRDRDPVKGPTAGTLLPGHVSTTLQRRANLAREAPQRVCLSLAPYRDLAGRREACRRTRKDAAPGVDGQSGADYAEPLAENRQGVLDRCKAGRYHAPPGRRAYGPTGDGSAPRPSGVPTFADTGRQRAVARVWEAV